MERLKVARSSIALHFILRGPISAQTVGNPIDLKGPRQAPPYELSIAGHGGDAPSCNPGRLDAMKTVRWAKSLKRNSGRADLRLLIRRRISSTVPASNRQTASSPDPRCVSEITDTSRNPLLQPR
jgi:hypothetical protein